jgi:hypothetical protein
MIRSTQVCGTAGKQRAILISPNMGGGKETHGMMPDMLPSRTHYAALEK